jgi:type IX secretion system PorP/SprF family membrane protein
MGVEFSVNRRIKIFIWGLLLLGTGYQARAQDPEFSQFFANPIYTNPAFAGSTIVGRCVTNVRSQWSSIAGSFRTGSASYDEHFDFINGGLGGMVTIDEAGVGNFLTLTGNAVYSYQIPITRYVTLRAGFQAGFVQKSIDFSKFQWYDQIIKRVGFVAPTQQTIPSQTVTFGNFAAGLVVYSSRFYAGFAVHNVTEPKQGFFSLEPKSGILPRRYTGNAGMVIPINQTRNERRASNLWPNILYMQQKSYSQLNIGMYYNKGYTLFGMYYRQTPKNADALIGIVGIRTNKIRIGVSYDQTISQATEAFNSWEVSLAFDLRKRVPRKTIRPIKCPEF